MSAGAFPPSFTVNSSVKDAGLIAAATRHTGTDPALKDAVACQFRQAAAAGHPGQDMAAVYWRLCP